MGLVKTICGGLSAGAVGANVGTALLKPDLISLGAAVVAFITVATPKALEAYAAYRKREREEDSKDREIQLSEFEREVRKRVELEKQVESLEEKRQLLIKLVAQLRQQVEEVPCKQTMVELGVPGAEDTAEHVIEDSSS